MEVNRIANMFFNNNITIVRLEQMDELKVISFCLMNLWTRVQHLEMYFMKYVKIEMVLRIILKKYTIDIPHLRSLCLYVINLNDKMVEQLLIFETYLITIQLSI